MINKKLIERIKFCDNEIAKTSNDLKQNRLQKQLFNAYLQETGKEISYSEWLSNQMQSYSADAIYGKNETMFDGGQIDYKEYFDLLDYYYCNAYCKHADLHDLKIATFRKIATDNNFTGNDITGDDLMFLNNVGTWIKEKWAKTGETLKSGSIKAKAKINDLKKSNPNLNFNGDDITGDDIEWLNSVGSFFAKFDPTDKNSDLRQGLNKLQSNVEKGLAEFDPTNPGSFANKTWKGIKTIGASPVRAVVLIMLRVNFLNMASIFKLTKTRKPDGYEKLKLTWYKLGGDRTKFDKHVEMGYNKKPVFAKKMDTDFLHFDDSQISFSADGEQRYLKIPPAVIATIPALAVLGAAIVPSQKIATPIWGAAGSVGAVLLGVVNELKIPLKNKESNTLEIDTDEKPPIDPNETGLDQNDDSGTFGGIKWYYWAGGAVLFVGALIGGYFLLKTKKK